MNSNKNMKKLITESVYSGVTIGSLTNLTLEEAIGYIKTVNEKIKKRNPNYEKILFVVEYDSEYGEEELKTKGYRYETDREYECRLINEKMLAEGKDKKEFEEYKKLKEMFEK